MIEVEGLTFTNPGAPRPAVRHISFTVDPGEVFGFLGPSGAGKSTTQNILIGLLRGWTGRAVVQGRSLEQWGPEYYRLIGVSFELPNHYLKLSARENLQYFSRLYAGDAEPVDSVLERVGLLEDGDKVVGAFSKGMKNRLNLARSLLHRPRLWFLDEPTSGLDPVNAVRVRQMIREQQGQGVTTVVTTHDMTTAEQVCDRVAFIVDGEVAAVGAPEDLRRQYGSREVEVRWEEGGVQRFSLDGLDRDPDFTEALARPGIASIHSQETTLEDVFVKVTGRKLT